MFCFVKVTFESDKFSFESRLSKATFKRKFPVTFPCERGLKSKKFDQGQKVGHGRKCMHVYNCVVEQEDASNSGTLMWDPKVVEDLTDEECECTITRHCCHHVTG